MNQTLRSLAISQATNFESYFFDHAWEAVAVEICRRHSISYMELNRAEAGENVVFLVDNSFIVKMFDWFSRYSRELRALTIAQGRCQIKIPSLLYNGEINGWFYVVTTQLAGRALYTSWNSVTTHDQLEIVSAVGVALRQLHSWEVGLTATEAIDIDNSLGRIERKLALALDREKVRERNPCWLGTLPAFIDKNLCLLPNDYKRVLLHGDLHPGNFLLDVENGQRKVVGLIDFADARSGFHEYDLIKPAMDMAFGSRTLQRTLLLAYGYQEKELDVRLRRRLMLLTILHDSSIWEEAVQRLGPWADNRTLEDLETQIWNFI